ncbi:MAG TPA: AAA family ATPase [Glaciibacter sp.]|nr:AAA family ATPase [Glaciibacter sp.]
MTLLVNYGQEIAATSLALQQLLAPAAPLVTTRMLNAARRGVSGESLNLALYRDQLITYRSGNDPDPRGQLLTELHYLVTAFAADDADTDAPSQRAFGAARAAIEETAILTVPIPSTSGGDIDGTMHVRLQASALPLLELTSLWLASQVPFALSFSLTASFALLRKRGTGPGPIGLEVVTSIARPGVIAVFSGADAGGKAGAAASVAQELGGVLVSATLEDVVSRHIGETEENLRRLFDRVERGRSVLLLDEADALFGSRTGVSDAHDRYAGVEVGPILELLARAPSLVIIAVGAVVGPELAERAAVEVRFPPDGH